MRNSVTYWPGIANQRNFGDFIAEYLLDELFAPVPVKARAIFVVGSCIDDMFFGEPKSKAGSLEDRSIFWGCGLRTPDGLSEYNRARCEILAVRGPLTRSALRLGDTVPVGDSALLLAALHQPSPARGGSICIPHFHDARSDAELLRRSGCERIVRPNLPESRRSLLEMIDEIAAADFVLTAALHGAVVAAAYGRPFAYWDNDLLDLPFKWADFAASLSIEQPFAKTLEEGRAVYAQKVAPKLRLPPLWPLLGSAPLALKIDAALKVLRFELRRGVDTSQLIDEFVERRSKVGDLSGRKAFATSDWVCDAIAGEQRDLRETQLRVSELEQRNAALERERQQLAASEQRRARLDVARRARAQRERHGLRLPFTRLEIPLGRRLLEVLQLRSADALLLATSPLFDEEWYATEYPDVAAAGVRPMTHYLVHGAWEGRNPSPVFDTAFYLSRSPALRVSHENPLCHYLRNGVAENLLPNAHFDPGFYLTQNPDVKAAGMEPLTHYLLYGLLEGRSTDPSGPSFTLERHVLAG